MKKNLSNEFYRGFSAGHQAAQPEWISVKDRLPERDGNYYTIAESQKGAPGFPIGTIAIDTTELWKHGKWYQDDECWKVLYWAKPIKLDVPEELTRRPRMGSL